MTGRSRERSLRSGLGKTPSRACGGYMYLCLAPATARDSSSPSGGGALQSSLEGGLQWAGKSNVSCWWGKTGRRGPHGAHLCVAMRSACSQFVEYWPALLHLLHPELGPLLCSSARSASPGAPRPSMGKGVIGEVKRAGVPNAGRPSRQRTPIYVLRRVLEGPVATTARHTLATFSEHR